MSPTAMANMQDLNRRIRLTNLAMCGATNPDADFSSRVEAFMVAMAFWPEGSLELDDLIRRHPDLATHAAIRKIIRGQAL